MSSRKKEKRALPKAIVIDIADTRLSAEDLSYRMAEAASLVDTCGGIVVVEALQRRSAPDPRTFVGSGKLEELADLAKELEADYLIINNTLKPGQIFNVENALRPLVFPRKVEVWDRVDLILKIFAKHAATAEAKLQITLASINHMGPRIYRMGMDLSQQGGGIGTRGAGETNTEMMRRHLRALQQTVKKKLTAYEGVRATHRAYRTRHGMKSVSLAGYTNAGKTSLLNALTRKGAYAADQLFATLDTSVGKLYLPECKKEVLLSDTIGFIQDLPPKLVSAFRSTLEGVVHSDLLLATADASDPQATEKLRVVFEILAELREPSLPTWVIWNKMDAVKPPKGKRKKVLPPLPANAPEGIRSFGVSALTGDGLEELKNSIGEFFTE